MHNDEESIVHCWNYRRWICDQSNTSTKTEFDYTTKKIQENFSNYSAWHNRSLLLSRLHKTNKEMMDCLMKGKN